MLISRNLTDVDRCPHCNVAKPLLEFRHYVVGNHGGSLFGLWVTYQCSFCHDVVSAKALISGDQARDINSAINSERIMAFQTVPEIVSVSEKLPSRAKNYLEQAIGSLSAPDGAVMLAASAVDAMLKSRNYTEGSIYSRIEKAASDHLITLEMAEWAHAVRLEANKPRHADIDDPHASREMATQSIEFAKVLGDILFVLPAKIAAGKLATSEIENKD